MKFRRRIHRELLAGLASADGQRIGGPCTTSNVFDELIGQGRRQMATKSRGHKRRARRADRAISDSTVKAAMQLYCDIGDLDDGRIIRRRDGQIEIGGQMILNFETDDRQIERNREMTTGRDSDDGGMIVMQARVVHPAGGHGPPSIQWRNLGRMDDIEGDANGVMCEPTNDKGDGANSGSLKTSSR